jgi:flavin reductase (DIM6/NTAB) family NADH-FMN oxidoreductase RutF
VEDFDALVGAIDYPLYIVTTVNRGGERAGCLIGFATQGSIEPPRFLAGLSKANHTFRVAQTATHLAVHVLARDDHDLAELFGGETGDETDKFARCEYHEGPYRLPILDGVDAWFVGEVIDRFDLGDHVGHLLAPVAVQVARPANLLSGDASDIEAGHPAHE